jgi:hypothetical protein
LEMIDFDSKDIDNTILDSYSDIMPRDIGFIRCDNRFMKSVTRWKMPDIKEMQTHTGEKTLDIEEKPIDSDAKAADTEEMSSYIGEMATNMEEKPIDTRAKAIDKDAMSGDKEEMSGYIDAERFDIEEK